MPFGPVNGPATFIAFIHAIENTGTDLACSHGVFINEDKNTNIIVDDILSWAKPLASTLTSNASFVSAKISEPIP